MRPQQHKIILDLTAESNDPNYIPTLSASSFTVSLVQCLIRFSTAVVEWLQSLTFNPVTTLAWVRSPEDALLECGGKVLILFRKDVKETTRPHNGNTVQNGVQQTNTLTIRFSTDETVGPGLIRTGAFLFHRHLIYLTFISKFDEVFIFNYL